MKTLYRDKNYEVISTSHKNMSINKIVNIIVVDSVYTTNAVMNDFIAHFIDLINGNKKEIDGLEKNNDNINNFIISYVANSRGFIRNNTKNIRNMLEGKMITVKERKEKVMITIEGTDYVRSYVVDKDKNGFFYFPPK